MLLLNMQICYVCCSFALQLGCRDLLLMRSISRALIDQSALEQSPTL